jgi:hypothetical protein
MAELRATPYANPLTGLSNDAIQGLLAFMQDKRRTQQLQGLGNLLESTGIPKTVERAAYADSPRGLLDALTNVNRANVPLLKPETAESLLTLSPVPSGAGRAAMAVGRAGERVAERVVPQILERGGLPAEMVQAMGTNTRSQIFIGSKSRAWDKDAAELAKKLEKKGESAEAIWEKTGTFKSPDGKWRQEISDQNIQLRSENLGLDREGNPIILQVREGKASQVMEYPELYNAYPFTKKIETEIGTKPKTAGSAEYGDEGRFIEAYGPTDDEIKSALVHEMQHQVQNREGMASGAGFMAGDEKDFQRYLRAAGEAEARAVQGRRTLSMEERRKLFPLSSYDVPINELDTSLPQKLDFGFLRSLL